MEKKDVVAILDEIGTLLELKGENVFKCNAYHNAARSLEIYDGSLETLISSGDLDQTKGIGKSLADKIRELAATKRLKYYEDLKGEIPAGLIEMLRIPGFGPKKAKAVWDKLGITTTGELEYACRENRLLDLPGFGAKTQEKILKGIEFLKRDIGRFHFNEAHEAAESLFEALSTMPQVIRIEIAGSLRRYKETIGDIDILVSTSDSQPIMERFVSLPQVENVTAQGETKSSVVLKSGINADLRAVEDKQFPFALHYFTGSKQHNVAVRARAKKLDFKLNEYGLFKGTKQRFTPCKDEAEIFAKIGLAYIPPELREDAGEIEAAERGALPRLVEQSDLRGTFHCHTIYSDGTARLADYAKAAQARGWEYIGIAEHSKSAAYANGLSEERIRKLHDEIDQINAKLKGLKILKGTEVDILPSGELDYSDKVLAQCDFVIASVHSRFTMSERDMTNRIIRAMKNPHVNMLGHPTGRLLLAREGYPVNIEQLIEAAAKYHVVIELNAHPFRFDLDWRYCRKAKEAGVLVSINPDAHNVQGLDDVQYGVGIARKGWLTRENVLNTHSLNQAISVLSRGRR